MGRSLLADSLNDAFEFGSALITIEAMAKQGRQTDALALVSDLARIAESKLPIIRAVITAQRQAAEMANLQQRPRLIAGAFGDVPPPKPNTTNDQPQAPSEPGPIIA